MSQTILIDNLTRPLDSPAQVEYCESFRCRLRGLMFRSRLSRDEGLLLVEKRDSRIAPSIHMLFVPFDLAVIWIDSGMSVVDKVIAKAWHPAYLPKAAARFTLEIHPARIKDYEIGDHVEIRHV
jgi:uncharacterized membrane protein (UPF0127 family)